MKIAISRTGALAGLALAASVAHAQIVPPMDAVEDVNVVGLGVGAAPDYMGSRDRLGAVAPVFRYQLKDSQRYFLLLGPQAQFNILEDQDWRFGPQVTYRFGRGGDVDNATVKQMAGINGAAEAGVFVTYRVKLSSTKMHQINFGGDIAAGSNGTVGSLRMLWWQPLTRSTMLSLGVGTTIASGKWMQTYFGVTNPADIALYRPTLGNLPFNAGSGVKSFNVPFGITQALSTQWLLSVGGRYEKLVNDAKNSPVTSVSGSASQWLFGAGLSYLF